MSGPVRDPGARNGAPPSPRALPGLAVAALTALVSGVAVFVNAYAVHSVPSPAVYTTAKNLVAALVLAGVALVGARRRARGPAGLPGRFVTAPGPGARPGRRPGRVLALLYVGIVGGGLAFVLFFDGLADTTAAPAAFWRDTLVIFVAVLAVPVLHERLRWWNGAAIAFIVAGQIVVAGGVGQLAADRGELLILASTVLWAVEVVVLKLVLADLAPATVSLCRMGLGAGALVVYLAATGGLTSLAHLGAGALGWVLLTGVLLAGYVGTWTTALARARALDVTSVLVGSALVTWLLQGVAGTAPTSPEALGLLLVGAGVAVVMAMGLRQRAPATGRAPGVR